MPDSQELATMAVFQYLIGDTDWSAVYGHNIMTLRTPAGAVTAVPFDFDYSRLVDAAYAAPPPGSRVRSGAEPLDSAERRAERIVAACRRPGPQDE